MGPTLTAVQQAQAKFNDPAIREQVKGWYAQGLSFLDMLKELGIDPGRDIEEAIKSLSAQDVATIRDAMLETIDASTSAAGVAMPIDCNLTDVPARVKVDGETPAGVRIVSAAK